MSQANSHSSSTRSRIRSLREKTVQSIGAIFSVQILKRTLIFFVYLLLYRHLTSEAFGIFALCESYLIFAMIFSDLGIEDALTQIRTQKLRKVLATGFSLRMGWTLIALALLWMGADELAGFLGKPSLSWTFRVISLTVLGNFIGFRSAVLLKRRVLFQHFFWPELLAQGLASVLAILMALGGLGYWSLIVIAMGGYLFRSIILFAIKPYPIRWVWHPEVLSVIWGKALWGMCITLIYLLLSRAALFWMGRQSGLKDLGYFYLAFNWSNFMVTYGIQYTSRVIFPAVAQLEANHARLVRTFQEYLQRVGFTAITFNVLLGVMASRLIPLLAGEAWTPAVPLCQAMCIYGILRALQSPPQTVLYAMGHFRTVALLLSAEFLALIVGFFALRGCGTLGVIWVLELSKLLGCFLLYAYARKIVGIRWSLITAVIWQEISSGFLTTLLLILFTFVMVLLRLHNLVILFLQAVAGLSFMWILRQYFTRHRVSDLTPLEDDLRMLLNIRR